MKIIEQPYLLPVDIANWQEDEAHSVYPEGARDKSLRRCPSDTPYPFCIAKHRYLFKNSVKREPEQYWTEIIAYKIAVVMNINVPPAFVAFNSTTNQSGALIEWFLKPNEEETQIPGGDYLQKHIPNYDRKKGKQQNFETLVEIFSNLTNLKDDWENYWIKTFLFDALIGNTDRHQDNWATITKIKSNEIFMAPAFDNGSSLGWEISARDFAKFNEQKVLAKYISNGKHHMKWGVADKKRINHALFIKNLAISYPDRRSIMLDCLQKTNVGIFAAILNELTKFDVPVKLSAAREEFILKLLCYRHQELLNTLG